MNILKFIRFQVIVISLLALAVTAQAQISYTGVPISENFNALPDGGSTADDPWTDGSTLLGWYSSQNTYSHGTTYMSGNSSKAGIRVFGVVNELALGTVADVDMALGMRIKNNTLNPINSVTIQYTGEQWRYGEDNANYDLAMQSLQFSYRVANSVTAIDDAEFDANYILVPELSFVGPQTTPDGLGIPALQEGIGLNGNVGAYRATLTYEFNISIPAGDEVMFKWWDNDNSGFDHGLAIDDLTITFSNSTVSEPTFTGENSMYHYLGEAIASNIVPEDDALAGVNDPAASIANWRTLVNNIITANYAGARALATPLGYELINFTDESNPTQYAYYVLRHNGNLSNLNNWGTYVFNVGTTDERVNISAPHPIYDGASEREAAYVYHALREFTYLYAISGAHRCEEKDDPADNSGCSLTDPPTVCGLAYWTISDPAHSEGIFQATHEEVADANPLSLFPQFHQFSFELGDPEFIVSNGTNKIPGSDYVEKFRDYINADLTFNFAAKAVHLDPSTKLFAYTNVLGRHLNNFAGDICSDAGIAANSSDRFMHIEQLGAVTGQERNYDLVVEALKDAYGLLDNSLPTVEITSNETGPINGDIFVVTISFNELVINFDISDITVLQGTKGAFSGSGSTYTLEITPDVDATGTVTVQIAANVAEDGSGNQNSAATDFTIDYDSESSNTSISSLAPDPTDMVIPITIEFDEVMTGFELADINVGNGLASNLTTGDNITFTADITAIADGSVTVDIAADEAVDAVGNGNTVATQFNITFDRDNAPSFIGGGDIYLVTDVANPQVKTYTGWASNVDDEDGGLQNDGVAVQALLVSPFTTTGNTLPGLFDSPPIINALGNLDFTIAANQSGTATITITITDDGTSDANNDNSSSQDFTITVGTSFLVLNEVLVFPGSVAGDPDVDSNQSGDTSSDMDEFIELVNYGDATLDIENWTINDFNATDGEITRHTFPAMILPVNQPVVVFGKGVDPEQDLSTIEALYPEVIFMNSTGDPGNPTSTATSLGLTNGGDQIIIRKADNSIYTVLEYPSQSRTISYTRSEDIFEGFTTHPNNSAWQNDDATTGNISPGRRTNDESFFHDAPTFSASGDVQVLENSGLHTLTGWAFDIDDGDTELTQTLDQFNVSIDNDPSSVLAGIPTILLTGELSFTLNPNVTGTAVINVTLSDLGLNTGFNANTSGIYTFNIIVENSSLKINEVLAWPAGGGATSTINSNGVGTAHFEKDEFIELVYTGAGTLDIDGWKILVDDVLVHTFPDVDDLIPNRPVLIFGGDTDNPEIPTSPYFSEAIVLLAEALNDGSENALGLTNSGATIRITDDLDVDYLTYTYPAQSDAVSYTRDTDITGTQFEAHPTNSAWQDEEGTNGHISPGKRTDNTSFFHDAPTFTASGDVQLLTDVNPQVINFTGWILSSDDGDPDLIQNLVSYNVTLPSGDPDNLFADVPSEPTVSLAGDLTFTIAASAIGSATIEVTLTDDGIDDVFNDNTSTTYTFEIRVGNTFLAINEIMAWPTGGGGATSINANGAGVSANFANDEFIELVAYGAGIDLDGWKLYVDGALKHTFPNGSSNLLAGQPLVLYSGDLSETPTSPYFAEAIVQEAISDGVNENTLDLLNSGSSIVITDAGDFTQLTFAFPSQTNAVSYNRDPEITGTTFISHPTNSAWQNDDASNAKISPGKRTDNTSFFHDAPAFTGSGDVQVLTSAGAQTITGWAFDITDGDPDLTQTVGPFTVTVTADPGSLFVGGTKEGPVIDPVTGNLTFRADDGQTGIATVEVTLADDGLNTGFNANTSDTYTFSIIVSDSYLAINEVLAWPAGSTSSNSEIDANGDGGAQNSSDEFIELVYYSTNPVNTLDIDGWTIEVDGVLKHTFPASTPTLIVNQPVVVFGLETPDPQNGDTDIVAQAAMADAITPNSLTLLNSGATVTITDGTDDYVSLTYPAQERAVSYSRNVDIFDYFVSHPLNSKLENEDGSAANTSPGRRIDNSSFFHDAPSFNGSGDVQVSADSGVNAILGWASSMNTEDPELTQNIVEFTVSDITNPDLFTVDPFIDSSTGDLNFTLDGTNEGVCTVTISLLDDGSDDVYNDNRSADYQFNIIVGSSFLIINEVMPWPAELDNNAGGAPPNDGGVGSSEVNSNLAGGTQGHFEKDEFIEFVNYSTIDELDISSWYVHINDELKHTFPVNTTLAPNQALVLFGSGGTPDVIDDPYFDDVLIEQSNEHAFADWLELLNNGATIKVYDNNNLLHATVDYGTGVITRSISRNRIPDISGGFSDHPTNSGFQNDNGGPPDNTGANSDGNISPGRRYDNSSFLNQPPTFTIPGPIVNVIANSGTRTMQNFIQDMDDGDIWRDQGFTQFNVNNDNSDLFYTEPAIDVSGTLTFEVADEAIGTAIVTVSLVDDGSGIAPNVNESSDQLFTITITATNQVVINEFLAWPQDGTSTDATINANGVIDALGTTDGNPPGSGTADRYADEFVEIVNASDQIVDITGWTIRDNNGGIDRIKHTFTAPSNSLLPGQAIVIFGGGLGQDEFPAASIFDQIEILADTAFNSTTLGLTNGEDDIYLVDGSEIIGSGAGGNLIDQVSYGQQTRGHSMTRSPDLSGGFIIHPDNDAWQDGAGEIGNISPGKTITNNSFLENDAPTFTLSGNVFVFENTGAHYIDNQTTDMDDGDPELDQTVTFDVTNDNNDLFTVQPSINSTTGQLSFTLAADQPGIAVVDVVLADDGSGTDPNDSTSIEKSFSINVQAAGAGTVVFNEFMTWPAGKDDDAGGPPPSEGGEGSPEVNSNGQGSNGHHTYDEFIELVNYGNAQLDISGWKITELTQTRHVFPDPTILNPGQAIVVFSDGDEIPNEPDFGGAIVQVADIDNDLQTDDDLQLANNGDTFFLKNASDVEIDKFTYTADQNTRSISFTRQPELTGSWTVHPENPSLTDSEGDPAHISPGRKATGEPFNGQGASNNSQWNLSWDDTNLYVTVTADDDATQGIVFYLDTNPLAVINGGVNNDGSLVGTQKDNITIAPAFRANYVGYFKNGIAELQEANGANGWQADEFNGSYDRTAGLHTITIPWTDLDLGGVKPQSFVWSGYVGYENGGQKNVFGALPPNNPDELNDPNPITQTSKWYYIIENTDEPEDPFEKNSYVNDGDSNIGELDAYNITLSDNDDIVMTANWSIRGSLIFGTGSTLNAGSNTIALNDGSWDSGNDTFTPSTGTVTFSGTTPSTISGITTFNNLEIDNTGGITLLGTTTTVNNQLQLKNGVINTTASELLVMANGSTLSEPLSSDSYVDGPMQKVGTGDFIFPSGDGIIFAPIEILNIAGNASDAFTAEYTFSAHEDVYNITDAVGFDEVSDHEHWDLDRSIGTPNAQVRLYFKNYTRSGIDDPADIVVAHYSGGTWITEGGKGNMVDDILGTSGSILSAGVINSFSPFTGGGTEASNPQLPIELISFTGHYQGEAVALDWNTGSEINSSHYTVQRSTTGKHFTDIGEVKSANKSSGNTYEFTDNDPLMGTSYYRLRAVDLDGGGTLSNVVAINIAYTGKVIIYPNPITAGQSILNLQLNTKTNLSADTKAMIYDLSGRVVFEKSLGDISETGKITLEITKDIVSGIYLMKFNNDAFPPIKLQIIR